MSNDPADDQPISSLGEHELLQRLQRYCPSHLVGDDAAVLPVNGDRRLVVTADMLIDGVHFSIGLANPDLVTTSLEDVGWRAAAVNLSDLAAMGATPLGITVSLGLPSTVPVGWLDQLYAGMSACLGHYQTPILGGDLCRSPIFTVSITALGEVAPERQILRAAAQVGDAILCTGVHGASRAGLELLRNSAWGADLAPEARDRLKQAHQRPIPRLDVPPLLWAIDPPVRVAGMDSSDGLADAVVQICRASGVGARLHRDRLPMPAAFHQTQDLSEVEGINWVLYGGEDFELVLCLPRAIAERLVDQIEGAVLIGVITADPTVVLEHPDGSVPLEIIDLQKGFQHF